MASDTFMADGARNQSGKGSAFERRAWSAATSTGARRRSSPAVTRVRSIRSVKPIAISEKASLPDRPVEIPALTIPVTLKLPPRTVELLRKYAKSSGLTIGATVAAALHAFLRTLKRHGWSRIQEATHFESISHIRLIACSSRSSLRLTRFWSHVAERAVGVRVKELDNENGRNLCPGFVGTATRGEHRSQARRRR